jgi:mannonate dehydratase
MALEETWRWFGPKDPVTLKEVKQTGAKGIVSALHHIPRGEIWSVDEILDRKKLIEAEGFRWSVVESLPVHEDIKKRKNRYQYYIENYKRSIENLGKCGIDTICYNFMPVLDWSRTDLEVINKDGSISSGFEAKVFTAFDLFILKRPGAERDYNKDQYAEAEEFFKTLSSTQKEKLTQTILLGFPGSLESYTLEEFKSAVTAYNKINEAELHHNLYTFIKEIIPVAENAGIFMAIHPDDPPWKLLGLPRVVSNQKDIGQILGAYNSPANGLTLCTGSLGAGFENDLVEIVERFSDRINFIHLRNLNRNETGNFTEEHHLEGQVDMYRVIKALLIEQKKRIESGRKDNRMPMRPDHGHLMLPDQNKEGIYPGYSLFGRMRGLAELRGMQLAIEHSLEGHK